MRQTFLAMGAILLAAATGPVLAKAQSGTKGAAAAPNTPKIDQATLEQGVKNFQDGKYVDAEKQLHAVLDAIDNGKMAQNQLGNCLKPLSRIYHSWGRDDDALQAATRYRDFIADKLKGDPATRDPLLDENASELADILTALDRQEEAEKYLLQAVAQAEQHSDVLPARTLKLRVKLAQVSAAQGDTKQARQQWDRVIELGEAAIKNLEQGKLPATQLLDCVDTLSAGYRATDQFDKAIALYQRLLKAQSRDPEAAIKTRLVLGSLCAEAGQFKQALSVYEDELSALHQLARETGLEPEVLARMVLVYKAQGLESEARRCWVDAAKIYSQAISHAKQAPDGQYQLMQLLNQAQIVDHEAGQDQDAIEACRQLLKLRQDTLGAKHYSTFAAKSDLGGLYGAVGYYDLAKPLLADALVYWQDRKPAAPLQLARAMNDLAVAELGAGSLNEAKTLLTQALSLRQKFLQPDDERIAAIYANLAGVFLAKGDYARAVAQLDQAIDIYRTHGASAQESLSKSLLNRALIFRGQGLFKQAFDDCHEALQIYQAKFGNDSIGAIQFFNTLASLNIAQKQYKSAAKDIQNAWELCQRNKLEQEPIAGATLYEKARIEYKLGDTAQAERDWNAALPIQQKAGQTLQVARTLNYLAEVAAQRGQTSDAEQQYRKALKVQGSEFAYPRTYFITNCNLAEILHGNGKTDDAIKLVENAVNVTETPRSGAIGGEAERAETFADFDKAFDLLVSWNLELGRVDQAFASAERGRNRTFLDQMSLAGVDLRDTLKGATGDKLREQERTLRSKFATLQAEARTKQPGAEADKLIRQLSDAQVEYAQVVSAIHNASSYYRDQLSQGNNLKSLDAVRQKLAELKSVMLFYYAGAKQSFLLVIDPDEQKPQIVPLEIPAELVGSMSVKAGPVTRESLVLLVNQYLADVREKAGGRGLTGIVYSDEGVKAADRGTLLAEVLVPTKVRNIVHDKLPKSVIIVPDGALNELPFEALLLKSPPEAKYLLDVFPPIAYAPSANIFMNLLQRSAIDPQANSVLTVGNPKYPNAPAVPGAQRSVADVTRAAYLGLLGGGLPPLAATAEECKRIVRAFQGSKINDLEAEQATEGKLRANLPGCRFIHVAAHGLVDQQNENLFGAIALTPPATPSDSNDDGFLSVNEIFNLPLSGCELVALSACQTNVGPDRPLEAGSTIAQAFLAAGARRAVCSHWNVNDESTAELMGTFFEQIASEAKAANPITYAAALHEAQLKVRGQSKWSSPYYWAPFVLIGPPQ